MTHQRDSLTDPPVANRLTIDPHVHSAASYDGRDSVRGLLAAAADRGLDGLVVTDHDTIEASWRAVELAPEYDLLALPGIEVSTNNGHLLGIGVDSAPPPGEPLERTVRRIRAAGGVAVVPHPFQRSRHGVQREALDDCDGIETLNACSVTNLRNRQSRRFAHEQGYPRYGGSDAHIASEVGRAYTAVRLRRSKERSATAVLAALRDGRTRPCGCVSSRRRSLRKYARNARVKTRRVAESSVGVLRVAGARLASPDSSGQG